MSKQRYNQIMDEAYKNYTKKMVYHPVENWLYDENGEPTYRQLSQEEFINKCKIDQEFSERWGLKIEERELSLEERSFIARSNHYEASVNIKMNLGIDEDHTLHKQLDDIGIPTKLITLTYQNESIQFYL
jgi:hypothetical protein